MANFDEAKVCFRELRRPNRSERNEWESPYRLLGGAVYSLKRALESKLRVTGDDFPDDLPLDWLNVLLSHTDHKARVADTRVWVHVWAASFMLTNAIFRIASATEKVLGIANKNPEEGRAAIGLLKRASNPLSQNLTKAREYLRKLPPSQSRERGKRRAFLEACRTSFDLRYSLACAIIQTDVDKHISYVPRKELKFDFQMTTSAFIQACVVYNEALYYVRQRDSS